MNRSARYEPVPQRDDEVIILDSIHAGSYNYNSGVPNSVTPSVPCSPPPSFHSSQSIESSPATPRPTPSTTAAADHIELWGVAASTVGAETCAGEDALATIANLKHRVEKLEESLGRILLEKDTAFLEQLPSGRSNCCVTFTDTSPSLEKAIASSRNNCCVTYNSSSRAIDKNGIVVVIFIFVIVILTMLLVLIKK